MSVLGRVAAFVAVVVLAGCGGGEEPAPVVPWDDYMSGLQARIDGLESCRKLQVEFDAADRSSDVTMRRTGHNNADLMGYIYDRMETVGCWE